MKTTDYFRFARTRFDRQPIADEWIEQAIHDPIREQVQSDGRVRRWAFVESERKFLRVVLLEDGETVHNVFFDRRFRL